jgi:magnesium transporter
MHPVTTHADTRNQKRVEALLQPYPFTFSGNQTVGEVIARLRGESKAQSIVYAYVLQDGVMQGVVAMRELVLADSTTRLDAIMLRNAFHLKPDMPLLDAMRSTLGKHFPIYPVCDEKGVFLGIVRGGELFDEQAIEITAQAGSMVGVDAEERVGTKVGTSLKHRHPWLQVNMLTCFMSAFVVYKFEGVISEFVVLAVFLPVMTGQSINIGCQALAVTLRGITLGEVKGSVGRALTSKETLLGFLNGAFSGLSAALGIFFYAFMKKDEQAIELAAVLFLAMTVASVISGLAGALVPLALRRFGADPVSASAIFVTTIAEVAALAAFLGLATLAL